MPGVWLVRALEVRAIRGCLGVALLPSLGWQLMLSLRLSNSFCGWIVAAAAVCGGCRPAAVLIAWLSPSQQQGVTIILCPCSGSQ